MAKSWRFIWQIMSKKIPFLSIHTAIALTSHNLISVTFPLALTNAVLPCLYSTRNMSKFIFISHHFGYFTPVHSFSGSPSSVSNISHLSTLSRTFLTNPQPQPLRSQKSQGLQNPQLNYESWQHWEGKEKNLSSSSTARISPSQMGVLTGCCWSYMQKPSINICLLNRWASALLCTVCQQAFKMTPVSQIRAPDTLYMR